MEKILTTYWIRYLDSCEASSLDPEVVHISTFSDERDINSVLSYKCEESEGKS